MPYICLNCGNIKTFTVNQQEVIPDGRYGNLEQEIELDGAISGEEDDLEWEYEDDRSYDVEWETNNVDCAECHNSSLKPISNLNELFNLIDEMTKEAVKNLLHENEDILKEVFKDRYDEFIAKCNVAVL